MITHLKPCPFCGNQDIHFIECADFNRVNHSRKNYYYVVCPQCRVRTEDANNADDAVQVWNERSNNESA